MKKIVILCAALAGAVSVEASVATLYRVPLSSNTGMNYWFDRNMTSVGFLRYDGKTQADGVGYDGHTGVDFKSTFGYGIWAGANGTVYKIENNCPDGLNPSCGDGYGNHVRILHADGKVTIYGHMKQGTVAVSGGQSILCSRLLGNVGNSGKSTNPHLHFELRINNGPGLGSDLTIDPFVGPAGGGFRSTKIASYWVNQNGGYPTTQCQ